MFDFSYAALILPRDSCPPLSMRGFLRRGGGVGASPVSQLGIALESSEAVSAGSCDFGFFGVPRPIILTPRSGSTQPHELSHLRFRDVAASTFLSSFPQCSRFL